MIKTANIYVPNVGIALLRQQRNGLIKMSEKATKKDEDILNGVINLLDAMLDIAEGYA